MIIDIHTHIFPDKMATAVIDKLSRTSRSVAFTDGTLSGLIETMQSFCRLRPTLTKLRKSTKYPTNSMKVTRKRISYPSVVCTRIMKTIPKSLADSKN